MIPVRVRPGRPVITAAVAATALISGAGVALAATSSPSAPQRASTAGTAAATSAPSSPPSHCQIKLPRQIKLPGHGFLEPRPFFAVPGLAGPLGFGMFGAIHGQFVAPKQGGGYQTIDTQRGTVKAVSTTSLTVKSSDGYTRTYLVTSSTFVDGQRGGIASVKTGQTVAVLATVSGSSATATQIADLSTLPKMSEIKPVSPPVLRIGPCASQWIKG